MVCCYSSTSFGYSTSTLTFDKCVLYNILQRLPIQRCTEKYATTTQEFEVPQILPDKSPIM